jgi:hypothetical protein
MVRGLVPVTRVRARVLVVEEARVIPDRVRAERLALAVVLVLIGHIPKRVVQLLRPARAQRHARDGCVLRARAPPAPQEEAARAGEEEQRERERAGQPAPVPREAVHRGEPALVRRRRHARRRARRARTRARRAGSRWEGGMSSLARGLAVVGRQRGRGVRVRLGARRGERERAARERVRVRLGRGQRREDAVELRDVVLHRLRRVLGGAPERERPAEERAAVLVALVLDAERPLADGVLLPVLDGHEAPAGEARRGRVAAALRREHAAHARGADELDLDVAAARVLDPDLGGDVLELREVRGRDHRARDGRARDDALAREARAAGHLVEHVHRPVRELHVRRGEARLRRDGFPGSRGGDERVRVEHAEAVLVAERPAVRRLLPVRVRRVDLHGRAHGQVLHIAPRQVRAESRGKRDGQQRRGHTHLTESARA